MEFPNTSILAYSCLLLYAGDHIYHRIWMANCRCGLREESVGGKPLLGVNNRGNCWGWLGTFYSRTGGWAFKRVEGFFTGARIFGWPEGWNTLKNGLKTLSAHARFKRWGTLGESLEIFCLGGTPKGGLLGRSCGEYFCREKKLSAQKGVPTQKGGRWEKNPVQNRWENRGVFSTCGGAPPCE